MDVIDAGERVVVVLRPARLSDGEESGLGRNVTTFRDGKVVEMVAFPGPERRHWPACSTGS